MFAGEIKKHPSFGETDERSPDGFYRVEYQEIWPELDPYLMTREELDREIRKGLVLYRQYFPKESGMSGFALFVAIAFVVVVAAVAVAVAGAASAAGGASSAAASGASASGATATANASSAVAAGSTGASASGAASGYGAAAGSASAGATSSSAGFASQAFGWAQKAAPYVKGAGVVAKASGNDDEGDKMIRAANAIDGSNNVTEAGTKLFEGEMKRRQMEIKNKHTKDAIRERMKREQGSYAAWLRREAQQKKKQNPTVMTSGQQSMAKWLPIATPFVLWGLAKAGEE